MTNNSKINNTELQDKLGSLLSQNSQLGDDVKKLINSLSEEDIKKIAGLMKNQDLQKIAGSIIESKAKKG